MSIGVSICAVGGEEERQQDDWGEQTGLGVWHARAQIGVQAELPKIQLGDLGLQHELVIGRQLAVGKGSAL